jgi:hypothetical protein
MLPKRLFSFLFLVTIALASLTQAAPLIAEDYSRYLPALPPISITTMTSKKIKISASQDHQFLVYIPTDSIINLAITRNKNPTLSELIPGSFLKNFKLMATSDNEFEKTPVDAQIIINGKIQSAKIIGFNFSADGITLTIKAFSSNRSIEPDRGPGSVVINSSCIVNRAVCALGCNYVLIPDVRCRKQLGIL